MQRRAWVVGLAAFALVGGAACSDAEEEGSGERDAYVDAFVEAAEAGEGESDEDRDRCFAEAAVDAIGVTRLREAGVTPDEVQESGASHPADLGVEVTEADGEQYHERLSSCLDLREYVLGVVTAGVDLPDESVECLEEAFNDDLVRRVVIADFVQGPEAGSSAVAAELDGIYAGCAPSASS